MRINNRGLCGGKVWGLHIPIAYAVFEHPR